MKSKKMKRVIMGAMASMLMFGGIVKPVFANTTTNNTIKLEEAINEEKMENINFEEDFDLNCTDGTCLVEPMNFKEFIGGMKEYLKDINKTDLTQLEKLYNESIALEKGEKFDEATKKWEEFDKILEKYFKEDFDLNCTDETCLVEPMNFKEFIGDMKEYLKDINKTDLAQLEKLYNESTALDKEEKFEEASKKWEEFDKILEKYYKEDFNLNSEDEILISEAMSFKELIGSMKEYLKDINKTDLTQLEKLYNESTALEKSEKFDEATKKWEEFDKIIEKYFK